MSERTAHDTRENERSAEIARAAERLFALRGYDGVSIREIAAQAQVNSALVGYYFGTKEQLYRSLFERRYHDITATRNLALRALDVRTDSAECLRQIVRVWARPLIAMLGDPACRDFVMLLAREASDASSDPRRIFHDYLDPSAKACIAILRRALPRATKADAIQGYLWMIAAMSSYTTSGARAGRLGNGPAQSPEAFLRKLEIFIAAGLQALEQASAVSNGRTPAIAESA